MSEVGGHMPTSYETDKNLLFSSIHYHSYAFYVIFIDNGTHETINNFILWP